MRFRDADHVGRPIKILGLELNDYLELANPIILEGRLPAPGSFPVDSHVIVSENLARRGGYAPGSELVLDTPSGPVRFTVQSVMMDFSSDQGSDRARPQSLHRDVPRRPGGTPSTCSSPRGRMRSPFRTRSGGDGAPSSISSS